MITEKKLNEILPHGSGIDCDWVFNEQKNYWKCENAFHCMDENGFYVGYADFSIIIPKKKPLDFRLHFHGARAHYLNNRNMLRDYLVVTIDWSLRDGLKLFENIEN